MRNRRLPSLFQHLAFTAMLALVLVPTVGRMAQGPRAVEATPADATPAAAANAHALHHGAHADPAAPVPDRPLPAPHHGASGDCDYCPLLQGLLTPGIGPPAPALALAPADPRWVGSDARFDTPYPTGLGSRGPPVA